MIISSDAHRHALVGIEIPSSGSSFELNGHRYAYAETTARGAPLGWVAPRVLSPNDWREVVMTESRLSRLAHEG